MPREESLVVTALLPGGRSNRARKPYRPPHVTDVITPYFAIDPKHPVPAELAATLF